MADQPAPHSYPDVLRYITDEPPLAIGVVEASLALRPRIVRAGRPLEAIVLLQNMSENDVDVRVALQIPEKDAQGKKDRFLAKNTNLVVDLRAAEVGYVKLPMTTLPDTAISNKYSIGIDISQSKPSEKPVRVRRGDSEKLLDPSTLPENIQNEITELKKLKFSAQKRRKLRGNTFEAQFSVLAGKVGSILNLEPGWQSLWTLKDQNDEDLLLSKFRDVIRDKTLPRLRRQLFYEPLHHTIEKRFEDAGYPLMKIEADAITRLLTLIIEYGNATRTNQVALQAGHLYIEPLLKEKRMAINEEDIPLPRWASAFLRAVARDERIASVPERVIPVLCFDDLLYDAMHYSFQEIGKATGENLGTEEETDAYIDLVIDKLSSQGQMDISYAYMPLLIGGIMAFDKILLKDERLADVLGQFNFLLDDRKGEKTEDNALIFDMTQQIMEQTLRQYGVLDNRH